MNSKENYQRDLSEAMGEDPVGTQKFIAEERVKALATYPKGEEIKYCPICGEPMYFNSIAYEDGYHIDSCI